jgi:hypothetical protein
VDATAHKLARFFYHLVTMRQPYDDSRLAKADRAIANAPSSGSALRPECWGFSSSL